MGNISDVCGKSKVSKQDVLDILCFRNKTNILALRQHMGDEAFMAVLDKFSGTYIRFPKIERVIDTMNDAILATLFLDMRRKSRKGPDGTVDAKAWHEAEVRFFKQADKSGVKHEVAKARARGILKELESVKGWRDGMDNFEAQPKKDFI